MTKPISDEQLAELDKMARWVTEDNVSVTLRPKEWAAIRERLRLAEAVVGAAEYTVFAMEWKGTDLNYALNNYRAATSAGGDDHD